LGAYYIVNIKVGFAAHNENLSLEETVNYEDLLEVVKTHFKEKAYLLEKLVQSMASAIKEKYPLIEYQSVSVKKNNPPLGTEVESSEVSLEKRY
jgi:hypothetical protein